MLPQKKLFLFSSLPTVINSFFFNKTVFSKLAFSGMGFVEKSTDSRSGRIIQNQPGTRPNEWSERERQPDLTLSRLLGPPFSLLFALLDSCLLVFCIQKMFDLPVSGDPLFSNPRNFHYHNSKHFTILTLP